ncbi:MAG: metallophosphoesterase family protein [Cyclobacteriaceae bacterium]
MKAAALYDIHGNLPALEAVLSEIRELDIDRIVVGGDVIVGPMSMECLDLLMNSSIPVDFIYGNCETAVLNKLDDKPFKELPESVIEEISWTADSILPKHVEEIRSWPLTTNLDIDGLGAVLFCHATTRNEDEIFTRQTSEEKLLPVFGQTNADVITCGHTHMSFDRIVGKKRIVNAGSVGIPFGNKGAHWLSPGPNVEFKCTLYDIEQAAFRVCQTEYPHAKEFANNNVLNVPAEKAMLDLFSKVELTS